MSGSLQRFVLWIVIVFAIALINALMPDTYEFPRRPLPPFDGQAWSNVRPDEPPEGEPVRDPSMDLWLVADGKPEDSVGTAFLVAPGTWVTAGHVLEHCSKAYVRFRNDWWLITSKTIHPAADVAIATSDAPVGTPRLQLTDRLPALDQDGFHFGYPRGEPGSVYTRFIGVGRIRQGRPGTPVELGWVWARQDSKVSDAEELGGISGGPQVDRTGAVQGITILSSDRAARLTTTPVHRAREILGKDVAMASNGGTSIDPKNYAQHGDHVRDVAGSVALVFCAVSPRSRPKTSG